MYDEVMQPAGDPPRIAASSSIISQLFIPAPNEPLPVVAVCVSNKDGTTVGSRRFGNFVPSSP
jgi:hypothetical protein